MPDVKEVQQKLGYTFRNEALLQAALTHPSFSAENRAEHYQRLEFLGDAVLELVCSRFLYDQYPKLSEGALTRMRAERVREESLAQAARRLELNRNIRLSLGEIRCGGADKPSILADVTEAIIGAIYLDGGLEEARKFIDREILSQELPESVKDAKSRLQELLQKTGRAPVYELISAEGPSHAPVFEFSACVDGKPIGRGCGTSKQAAQQAAAKDALEQLKG